jgi:hypothetical protein
VVELLGLRAARLVRVAVKSSGRLHIVADCRQRTFEASLGDSRLDGGTFAQATESIVGVSFATGERASLKSPADDRLIEPARYRIRGFHETAH